MGFEGALLIGVVVFLVLFPIMLLLSEMWSGMTPIISNQSITGNNATVSNSITRLGDSFFYYMPDSIIVLMYFALIGALFISGLYENARPETLPIGLLFLIPLILVTLPLSDLSHWLYMNPGFANVAGHYTATEYLSDNSPLITTLCTVMYLVFVITKKHLPLGQGYGGNSGNVVSG